MASRTFSVRTANFLTTQRGQVIVFGVFLLLALCFLVLVPHTDPDGARAWLEGRGYTQVEITGFSFFACDETSIAHTGFHALDAAGKVTSGTVCRTPLWGNWLSWI